MFLIKFPDTTVFKGIFGTEKVTMKLNKDVICNVLKWKLTLIIAVRISHLMSFSFFPPELNDSKNNNETHEKYIY